MQRTYSRKGVNRRNRFSDHAAPISSDSDPGTLDSEPPAKRQKLTLRQDKSPRNSRAKDSDNHSVDLRPTASRVRHPGGELHASSPSVLDKHSGIPTTSVNEGATNVKPESASPLVRSDTLPEISTPQMRASPSPVKGARDLSNLFNFTAVNEGLTSPPKPSTSVARRMLRRTATESSRSTPGGSFASEDSHDALRPTPHTPTKVSKTRSDSVIDLTGSPSSRPLSQQKSQSLEDVSSPPQGTRPTLTGAAMRTYAGKSRSFLVALPAAQLGVGGLSRSTSNNAGLEDGGVGLGSQEDDFEIEESYTDRRIRLGIDNSEDDPRPWSPPPESASPSKKRGKGKQAEPPPVPLPNGMMNDLKSITELRSKGENRRFLDEVGYLFEGLEAGAPLNIRRASALEIVTKLCDTGFARKAKAADFIERTWEVLREAGAGNGDRALDTILAFYAALVSRDPRDLTDLAERSDFLYALYSMLDGLQRPNDPLWLISCGLSDPELRKAGIQRMDKTLLTTLARLVRKKSGLFDSDETISNRLLISTALAALPSSCQDTVHITSLLRACQHEFSPLTSRLSVYESGLPILSEPSPSSSLDAPGFGHADNCLRLLDSYLLSRWPSSQSSQESEANTRLDPEREENLTAGIVSLCTVCDVVARDPDLGDYAAAAYRCMESALRVLISLTHDDAQWCQAVLDDQLASLVVRLVIQSQRLHLESTNQALKQESVEERVDDAIAQSERTATSLDRQCLALGILTNLAQVSHAARDVLRSTKLSFHCTGKRACTVSCHCSSRTSALSCLALAYSRYGKSEAEDGVESMIRGHMAVLFGLLMRDSPENQRVLLDTLPGISRKQKVEKLVEHARDFTNFYVNFTRRVSQVVQSQSQTLDLDEDGPSEDLGGYAVEDDRVGRMLGDSHGAAVANEVVSFLDSLIRNE